MFQPGTPASAADLWRGTGDNPAGGREAWGQAVVAVPKDVGAGAVLNITEFEVKACNAR